MVDIVSSITTAIDIVKRLRELGRKVSEADFKMLLADLTSELGDAKLNAANLKIELAETKDRIAELERQASHRTSDEPEVHEGAYVFGDGTRHYCTGCYDTGGKKILLNQLPSDFAFAGKWQCPVCDKTFGASTL